MIEDGAVLGKEYYGQHHSALEIIRDRYAWKCQKVRHHSDCEIHRAIDMYGFANCTCGLIHDMIYLPAEMAERLYPKFSKDRARDDDCWIPNPNPKGVRYIEPHREPISQKEIDNLFGSFKKTTVKIDIDSIWGVIQDVFGEETTQVMKLDHQQSQMAKAE